jgi:membrane fusion protein (multidrug efflux system)
MKKRIIFAVVGLVVLIAVLAAVKSLQIGAMIAQAKNATPPPDTVTAVGVRSETWNSTLTAVGSLSAVQGVTVAAELPGKVVRIEFEAGRSVRKGDILLRQDTTSEEAQLPGATAQVKLKKTELDRAKKMLAEKIVSQADFDTAAAAYAQAVSQADNIRATIGKKTIRAPFTGRLGIRQANLGQILREGDPIVTLQSLDPIYVDFSLPQQQIADLRKSLPIHVTCDALPGAKLEGRLTAINPLIDSETRNVKLQGTLSNRKEKLQPGMFVNVDVGLPSRKQVLTLPATAVLYAPYGDSVFVISGDGKGKKTLRQQFVRLGEKRGDFVAVTAGLKPGETVVSTGVFKLRNGMPVVVDNKLSPQFRQAPTPENN